MFADEWRLVRQKIGRTVLLLFTYASNNGFCFLTAFMGTAGIIMYCSHNSMAHLLVILTHPLLIHFCSVVPCLFRLQHVLVFSFGWISSPCHLIALRLMLCLQRMCSTMPFVIPILETMAS